MTGHESSPTDRQVTFVEWCRSEATKAQRRFRAAQRKYPRQFGDPYGSWEAERAAEERDYLRNAVEVYKRWEKAHG